MTELLLSIIAAVLVGIVCGMQSFFVVYRKLAFMSHGVAHSMVAGVGLALLMHWPVYWPAIITALIVSLTIGWITRKGRLVEDSAIGIALSAALAVGIFLSARHDHAHGDSCGHGHDLEGYLVGSLTNVDISEMFWLTGFAVIALFLIVRYWKILVMFTFDPESCAIAGYPVEAIRYAILIGLALTIALTMKIVGILLVGAFLIIPAASAAFWSNRASAVLILSVVVALIGAVIGMLFADWFHTPPGATIVLALVAIFFVSRLFGRVNS
ncbi:metal ABC transporter permease [bacterium]|nr:metal ABC transporter permease [bacterium]